MWMRLQALPIFEAKLIKLARSIWFFFIILVGFGCGSRLEYCSKDPEVNWSIMTLYNWSENPLDAVAFYDPKSSKIWTADSAGLMWSISQEMSLLGKSLIDEGRGHILEFKLLKSSAPEPHYAEAFAGAIPWNKIPKNTWILDVRLNMGKKLVLRTWAKPIDKSESAEAALKLRARQLCNCLNEFNPTP
jgi:hypothetical protein